MDEEDNAWLDDINKKRTENGRVAIKQHEFEHLMDRFEKESYFQSSLSSKPKENTNEDALCCICLDGECLNSNVILFCDMCNLAVHQECYGVPYIPEGQWLCRRCIQSPSTPVQCILCPNHKTGAYKQTDRGEWVHVVCAIWIPEVHFANTVFLEPVIGVEHIDRARWKLMCFICRRRGVGACIQCDKQNCYIAFHVTCAQQAGLYMNIQEEYQTSPNTSGPVATTIGGQKTEGPSSSNQHHAHHQTVANTPAVLIDVKKCAYCDMHTPRDSALLSPRTRADLLRSGLSEHELTSDEALKRAQRIRMKRTRKLLAERRAAPPVVSVPCISRERLDDVRRRVFGATAAAAAAAAAADNDEEEFMRALMNYWLLKRYARNGRPLLRRLQMSATVRKTAGGSAATTPNKDTTSPKKKDDTTPNKKETIKRMREDINECKKLREDLDKVRKILYHVREREQVKHELVRLDRLITVYEINPFNGIFLQHLMNKLYELDTNGYFWWPVDATLVPTYYNVIKQPMDLERMQAKIDNMEYASVEQFEADFQLIISNCFRFNPKSSPFCKAATKLKEQAQPILKRAKKFYESQSGGYNKPLEQLNIDTLALSSISQQLSAATSAATIATPLTTPNTTVSVDGGGEKLTPVTSSQPGATLAHSTASVGSMTPTRQTSHHHHHHHSPLPISSRSRRSSSSTTLTTTDTTATTTTGHMKTRSSLAAAAATTSSSSLLIEDETDSNNKSTAKTSSAEAASNTNHQEKDAIVAADATDTSTPTKGGNRRSALFKNKNNSSSKKST